MNTKQLAALYNVADRTIREDCKARIYPYTIRTNSTKNTPAYKIQSFIQYYPRQVWLNIKMLPPTLYGPSEREAFILAYNSILSIAAISKHLSIDRMDVRQIFDQLFNEGKVSVAYDQRPDKAAV